VSTLERPQFGMSTSMTRPMLDEMGTRLMAVVAEGERAGSICQPTEFMEKVASQAKPTWKPDTPTRGTWASNAQGRRYGLAHSAIISPPDSLSD